MDSEEAAVYLVIGANGGLGSALVTKLRARGARVLAAARGSVDEHNQNFEDFCQVEASNFESMQACVNVAVEKFGKLDGAVNCTGSLLLKPANLTSESEWHAVLANNLTSSFALLKYAVKPMMKNGGSIVFVSSAAAKVGIANHDAIAAAKAGIEGLVRSSAASYARQKIRINCLAPGLMETPLTTAITSNALQLEASIKSHPLGRIGCPADVIPAIEWLLSPDSSWVTGQCISIDGGLASLKTRQS
jgi:NAD(P)-dependent dehydrogenase (short-subunit alcohol dehydrogenase family)